MHSAGTVEFGRGQEGLVEAPASWPGQEDQLRLPAGEISEALMRLVIAGGADPLLQPAVLRGRRDVPFGGARVILESAAGRPERSTSALTLDVVLVVLDLLVRLGGEAPVSARIVLARKGYRRCGDERRAFERKVLGEIRLLEALRLQHAGGEQPLFSLAARNVAQTDFVVRAAAPLVAELLGHRCVSIDPTVLRLDHRRNRGAEALAKKLAVLLSLAREPAGFGAAELIRLTGELGGGGQTNETKMAERFTAAAERLRSLGYSIRLIAPVGAPGPAWLSGQVEVQRTSPSPAEPTGDPASGHFRASNDHEARDGQDTAPRRGRPRFVPNLEQRRLVQRLNAGGTSRESIARAIGVSLPTLRTYFAADLDAGRNPDVRQAGAPAQPSAIIYMHPDLRVTRGPTGGDGEWGSQSEDFAAERHRAAASVESESGSVE